MRALVVQKRRHTAADHLERSMLWLFNVQCAENMHLTACVHAITAALWLQTAATTTAHTKKAERFYMSPVRLRFSE